VQTCALPICLDFFHHLERRFAVGAFALGAAAQVVDHYLGAMLGEQQRVGAADTAAGAGDDDHLVFKTDVAHGDLLGRTECGTVRPTEKWRTVSCSCGQPARRPRLVNGLPYSDDPPSNL